MIAVMENCITGPEQENSVSLERYLNQYLKNFAVFRFVNGAFSALRDSRRSRSSSQKIKRWWSICCSGLQRRNKSFIEKENEPIPEDDYEQVMKLLDDHKIFQEEMAKKQPTYDRLTKSVKRRGSAVLTQAPVATPDHKQGRRGSSRIPKLASPASSFTREKSREKLLSRGGSGSSFTRSSSYTRERSHPGLTVLSKRWQNLWLLSMERLRRLQEKLERIAIVRLPNLQLFFPLFL